MSLAANSACTACGGLLDIELTRGWYASRCTQCGQHECGTYSPAGFFEIEASHRYRVVVRARTGDSLRQAAFRLRQLTPDLGNISARDLATRLVELGSVVLDVRPPWSERDAHELKRRAESLQLVAEVVREEVEPSSPRAGGQ